MARVARRGDRGPSGVLGELGKYSLYRNMARLRFSQTLPINIAPAVNYIMDTMKTTDLRHSRLHIRRARGELRIPVPQEHELSATPADRAPRLSKTDREHELLSCPFCGYGEPIMVTILGQRHGYAVRCRGCGAVG